MPMSNGAPLIIEILIKVKLEINQDPKKLGYAGKTPSEIVSLLNNPYDVVTGSVFDDGLQQEIPTTVKEPARFYMLIIGVPFAPNAITEEEVATAMKEGD